MIKHIYIHIPFCIKKCGYCSFYSVVYNTDIIDIYVNYLIKEIKLYSDIYELQPDTIYLGGGTPSLLTTKQLAKILDKFNLSNIKECTLEVNPASIDNDKVSELKNIPVNRVSIGMQSFNDDELKALGRIHNVNDNLETFNSFRNNGFENISIDLIYGLKEQSIDNLSDTISHINSLNPNHISTYCLSLDYDCELAKNHYVLPKDETSAYQYRFLTEELNRMNYNHYELSNLAKSGFESQHNSAYWDVQEFLGLGAAAHGFINNTRYYNPSSIDKYISLIDKGDILPNKTIQQDTDIRIDFIIQNFRLEKGIEIKEYNNRFNDDFFKRYNKSLKKYAKQLSMNNNFVKILKPYYFVSNEIISDFLC